MRRYQELAFRVALLLAGGREEAEEAAQDAFVKAYFALDRFRTDAPFRPWLLRIVANEARNRRKASGRREKLALRGAREADITAPSAESVVVAAYQREEVWGALSHLDEDDRLLIAYRYFFDLSEAEMAQAIGRPRGTVKSRLHRALQRLRVRIQSDGSFQKIGRGTPDG